MVFLKIVQPFVNRFRDKDCFTFFRTLSRILKNEEKHCNSENIEDLRTAQRQITLNSSGFFEAIQFKAIGHRILHRSFQRFETYA